MGTHITKCRRTKSGNYEATVYEVQAKRLYPVLVVHGSEALVARAKELLPLAANDADLTDTCGSDSGTFCTAITDDGDGNTELG